MVFIFIHVTNLRRPLLRLGPRIDSRAPRMGWRLLLNTVGGELEGYSFQAEEIIIIILLILRLYYTRPISRHLMQICLPRSIIFIGAANVHHVVGVLLLLGRAGARRRINTIIRKFPLLEITCIVIIICMKLGKLLATDFVNALDTDQVHLMLPNHGPIISIL